MSRKQRRLAAKLLRNRRPLTMPSTNAASAGAVVTLLANSARYHQTGDSFARSFSNADVFGRRRDDSRWLADTPPGDGPDQDFRQPLLTDIAFPETEVAR